MHRQYQKQQLEDIVLKEGVKVFFKNLMNKYLYLYQQDCDKDINCSGQERFNESWDVTVMYGSPVSSKLSKKEENTLAVFEETVSEKYLVRYRDKLCCLLCEPSRFPEYESAILEIMEEFSECNLLFKKPMSPLRFISYDDQIEGVEFSEKGETFYEKMKEALLKGEFVLNQVPKLRKNIFAYNGRNKILKKFLNKLESLEYSIFIPD